MYQNVLKWKFWHSALSKLNFGVFWKPKIVKNFLHELGTTYFNWLCLKLEKRPSKGQKRPSYEIACLFHSATYSEICQQFCQIWSKLLFSKTFLHLAIKKWPNMHKSVLEAPKKILIITYNLFVYCFLATPLLLILIVFY